MLLRLPIGIHPVCSGQFDVVGTQTRQSFDDGAEDIERVMTTYHRVMNQSDVWYTPLVITNVSPSLNSGSDRTRLDMNRWVDQQIDVFARYIVTYRAVERKNGANDQF